jgi:hypothetical protein
MFRPSSIRTIPPISVSYCHACTDPVNRTNDRVAEMREADRVVRTWAEQKGISLRGHDVVSITGSVHCFPIRSATSPVFSCTHDERSTDRSKTEGFERIRLVHLLWTSLQMYAFGDASLCWAPTRKPTPTQRMNAAATAAEPSLRKYDISRPMFRGPLQCNPPTDRVVSRDSMDLALAGSLSMACVLTCSRVVTRRARLVAAFDNDDDANGQEPNWIVSV